MVESRSSVSVYYTDMHGVENPLWTVQITVYWYIRLLISKKKMPSRLLRRRDCVDNTRLGGQKQIPAQIAGPGNYLSNLSSLLSTVTSSGKEQDKRHANILRKSPSSLIVWEISHPSCSSYLTFSSSYSRLSYNFSEILTLWQKIWAEFIDVCRVNLLIPASAMKRSWHFATLH